MEPVNVTPETRGRKPKVERNEAVRTYYLAGHTVREVARAFKITPQRVGQLVRGLRSAAETIRLRRGKRSDEMV